ncbi:unnamed protein product, partial [Polarella glacialis]
PDVMTVADCWLGLELARDKNWIPGSLEDGAKMEETCRMLTDMTLTYDAQWLVRDRMMVSSDPMTTVMDPNPITVGALGQTPKGWIGKAQGTGPTDFLTWWKEQKVTMIVRANFGNEHGLVAGSYEPE